MLRKLFLFQTLLIFVFMANARVLEAPDLPGIFHAERRAALRETMPENSVAVFFSYPIKTRSNDVDFYYKANPDFYYLSGFDKPDAVLFVFKQAQEISGEKADHLLLIPPEDKQYESWNGNRITTGYAKRNLQLKAVSTTDVISSLPVSFDMFSELFIQYPRGSISEGPKRKYALQTLVKAFDESIAKSFEKVNQTSLDKWMAQLREVKAESEIEIIQHAINATGKGLVEVMKAVQPGMKEYQAQAIIEYHFKSAGAEHPGFPSIVGAGENACILHYVENNGELEEHEMLIMDVGAEIHGYSADVTRSIPVDGKFSEEEKAIYTLVLNAQEAGIKQCINGNTFFSPHQSARKVISKGLVDLRYY